MKLQESASGRLVGHIGFLFLMVMSVVLAQERVLFVDSAAQIFEMIQRGTFAIYDHRYTMAVTQLLPLLGIKLGLPLPVLVVLYSLSAPLLGYLVFLLIAYRVKDVPIALLILLPMLCICHTFFHAISETFSLMIYATLLLVLLRHQAKSILLVVGVVLCTLACVFMHPIGMFFVLYLLGYHWVTGSEKKEKKGIVAGGATLLVAVSVKLFLPSGHDASYIPHLADALWSLRHPFGIPVVQSLFSGYAMCWLVPLVLYVIDFVWHLRHRLWLRLAWGATFNIGFILLTAIVYRTDTSAICVERAWLPLVFFAGVPVVCEVVSNVNRRIQIVMTVAFSLSLVLAFVKIVDSSKLYRQRLETLQEIVDDGRREGHRKLVAPIADVRDQFEVQSWATAFETLILSSLQGPENTATLYLEEEEPFDENIPDYGVEDAYLAVPWNRLWNYSTLDSRYFRLPLQRTTVIKKFL